jgi:hypothetical protein
VKVTVKPGKLIALVADGGGEATLNVTLSWSSRKATPVTGLSQPPVGRRWLARGELERGELERG